MNVPLHKWSTLVWTVSILLFSSNVVAQTDQERSAARETAKAGISEFRKENYSEALRLLETAEEVVHAPTHLLYMARSQVKVGLLVEARETYLKIINEELSSGASRAFQEAQDSAREELSQLASRIPKLKITLQSTDGSLLEDVAVRIDDQLLSSGLIHLPIPANPGARVVSATADGMQEARAEVTLEEGDTEEVTLTLERGSAAEEIGDGTAAGREDGGANSQSPGRARRTVGWIAAGSGAALVGGGAVLGILSSAQLRDARDDDTLCSDDTCTEDGWTEVDQAKVKALIGDISMGVGIATIGVGVYLLVTGKKSTVESARMRRIVPYADRHGGYLAIQGGF